ncbi:MAG: GlmU family protein [Bacteroidia bacterium]|nr:GlmU family protein [Bacteroidia bacterium]
MNIILFDDDKRVNLLPLTFTRPCGELRVGILTIAEKWSKYVSEKISHITQDYLANKYDVCYQNENVYINGRVLPSSDLIDQIKALPNEESLTQNEIIIALKTSKHINNFKELVQYSSSKPNKKISCSMINHTHDIFTENSSEIKSDYDRLTEGRKSQQLSSTNTIIGKDIFVEDGVRAEAVVFNTENGPIYLGKNSTVMEGSIIRGPFGLGENATIKMGAKIYGDTSVGPQCKVGGEVSNSVFYKNTNKGHDGFIGNSVIGEWCNLGADTNSSNLKNNYASVKLWDYSKQQFLDTGLQFCGLIMGDHSKCGINTMFNTGTVVGVSANIFGGNFPRNFIPSFTWGGSSGFATYQTNKAFQTAKKVMERRNEELTEEEQEILTSIFNNTAEFRFWEKTSIK